MEGADRAVEAQTVKIAVRPAGKEAGAVGGEGEDRARAEHLHEVPVIARREKKDLEGGLKKEYQEQEEEKYRLIEEIHELGDAISKQKE